MAYCVSQKKSEKVHFVLEVLIVTVTSHFKARSLIEFKSSESLEKERAGSSTTSEREVSSA